MVEYVVMDQYFGSVFVGGGMNARGDGGAAAEDPDN
jgi:hypothetical protein